MTSQNSRLNIVQVQLLFRESDEERRNPVHVPDKYLRYVDHKDVMTKHVYTILSFYEALKIPAGLTFTTSVINRLIYRLWMEWLKHHIRREKNMLRSRIADDVCNRFTHDKPLAVDTGDAHQVSYRMATKGEYGEIMRAVSAAHEISIAIIRPISPDGEIDTDAIEFVSKTVVLYRK